MAEEQKARMQAIKDSEFRAANDDGEPAQQTSPESGLAARRPNTVKAATCPSCKGLGTVLVVRIEGEKTTDE